MVRTVGSKGDETLHAIRRSAADLMTEHGFEAMNLRQLAARIGITAGALYNHIGSKQELLHGLVREVMEDLLAAVENQVLCHTGASEQFQAFVQLHLQFHIDRKNDVLIATTELRSLESRNRESIIRLRNTYEAILCRIIRRGCRERLFDVADPKLAALALLPMLTGVSHWFKSGGRLGREEILRHFVGMANALVGAKRRKVALLPVELTARINASRPIVGRPT